MQEDQDIERVMNTWKMGSSNPHERSKDEHLSKILC